jgi:putative membrane protein
MREPAFLHALALMLFVTGCSTAGTVSPQPNAVQSSGASGATAGDVGSIAQARPGATLTAGDRRFIMQAAYFTAGEWQAGQAAIVHSPSPGMRAFGRSLSEESFQANRSLANLALAKGIVAPIVPDGPRATRLQIVEAQVTWNFDEAFIANQIAEHQASIPVFEAAATGVQDPDLRAYARDTLPSLVHRLDELRTMGPVGSLGTAKLAAAWCSKAAPRRPLQAICGGSG